MKFLGASSTDVFDKSRMKSSKQIPEVEGRSTRKRLTNPGSVSKLREAPESWSSWRPKLTGVQQVGVLFFARLCPCLLSVIHICLSCGHSYPMCLGYVSIYIYTYIFALLLLLSTGYRFNFSWYLQIFACACVCVCVSIHIVYSHFINLVIYWLILFISIWMYVLSNSYTM